MSNVLRLVTVAALAAAVIGCGTGGNTSKDEEKAFKDHPDAKSIPAPPKDAMKPPASTAPPQAMTVGGQQAPTGSAPPPGAMPGGPKPPPPSTAGTTGGAQ
ncbi:MAG TPA: hypothetical protein VKT78_12645 [Fimbriimonadaceae bacterium]|nr:hypothetical protein [Fimbriimonadaceae bacterium]